MPHKRAGGRSEARRTAMQAIYQWQMTGQSSAEVRENLLTEEGNSEGQHPYFDLLLQGVIDECPQLDRQLTPLLDRPVGEVDPVERAILRLGAFELLCLPDVPLKVAINEAVELAKRFGAEKGHRYVNGVLDRLAKHCRGQHRAGANGAP